MLRLDAALRRAVKMEAKARIFAHFPYCIAAAAAYLVPMLLIALLTAVPVDASIGRMLAMFGVSLACEVFLLGPILMGMQYFLVDIARGRPASIATVFLPLGDMRELLRGIRMVLCLMFRMVLLSIVPTALYVGAAYAATAWMDSQGISDMQTIYHVVLLLIGVYFILLLPAIGRMASYLLGYALLRDNPDMGVWRATREGSRLLHGQRRAMLAFVLSFLPWWIGGFFTCGLTMLFGVIYLCVSLFLLGDRLRLAQSSEME